MVISNKDLINELKDYNQKLDSHLSGVDISLMKAAMGSDSNSESVDSTNFQKLFAENLLDLRTEVALVRKHMSTDIEGMILRVINQQQTEFAKRMNDFFLKTALDMKNSFNSSLKRFSGEISDIKRSYNDMSIQNANLTQSVKELLSDMSLINSNFSEFKTEMEDESMGPRIDDLTHSLNSAMTHILKNERVLANTNKNLSLSLNEISKRLHVSHEYAKQSDRKLLSKVQSEIDSLKEVSGDSDVVEIIDSMSEKFENSLNGFDDFNAEEKNTYDLDGDSGELDDSIVTNLDKDDTKEVSERILNVDERLSRLSSLK